MAYILDLEVFQEVLLEALLVPPVPEAVAAAKDTRMVVLQMAATMAAPEM